MRILEVHIMATTVHYGRNTSSRRDWSLFWGGVALCVIGVVFLLAPGLTLVSIAAITGAILILAAVADFISFFQARKFQAQSGWTLFFGLLNLILGALFLLNPVVTADIIPWVAGIFVLAYGIIAVISAVAIRQITASWSVMLLNGIVSIFCGLVFMFAPAAFTIFLAIFLLMRGLTMSIFGVAPALSGE
jgi:uncharacterized membrane protein HdeD (DUF308 family)